MIPNRIIRDVSILVVVSLGAWAIYQTLSMFGGWNSPKLSTEGLSPERVSGDQAFLSNRWSEAIEPYRTLIEADEFNSTAWFRLGEACWRQFLSVDDGRTLFENKDSGDTSSGEPSELESLLVEARAAYEQARTYAQFRNESQVRLAEIHVRLGENEEALLLLRESLTSGYITSELKRSQLLSRLREFDRREFDRLEAIETQNINQRKRGESRGVAL